MSSPLWMASMMGPMSFGWSARFLKAFSTTALIVLLSPPLWVPESRLRSLTRGSTVPRWILGSPLLQISLDLALELPETFGVPLEVAGHECLLGAGCFHDRRRV